MDNGIEARNLAAARAYLAALESGAVGDKLARFFAADAVQVELPNRLNPKGGQSDVPTLLKRAEQGAKLMQRQSYEVRSAVAQGARVAVEAAWTGVLAVPFGSVAAGGAIKAHLAMFFEFAGDGRIALLRNYDCFEAW